MKIDLDMKLKETWVWRLKRHEYDVKRDLDMKIKET